MTSAAIRALIKNDLRIYATDRRALIIGVLVPILIAAFFGYVFGGNGNAGTPGKIPIAFVDEDQSVISRAIAADLAKDPFVSLLALNRAEALARVRAGKSHVAAVIPENFGDLATRALFTGAAKPQVELLIDPSQSMSGRVVEGLLAQYGMHEITAAAFSGASGQHVLSETLDRIERVPAAEIPERADLKALLEAAQRLNSRSSTGDSSSVLHGLSIPYLVATTAVTSRTNVPYNGYAHSFAGMTTQFILFAGIDAGVVLLLLRERGIWQRLRSAPLSKAQFLLAKSIATTLIGLVQFTLIYAAAIGIFGVRIDGSVLGFVLLALAFCLLNATFGLMLASIGRSPGATRGIAAMATLLLVMVGGAWVPSFVFPKWLQQVSLAAPTRWAVDGFDAMTWRGLDFSASVMPLLVLSVAAAACLGVAIWRFRWEGT
jgi:ABC-2 type transport system permease protein